MPQDEQTAPDFRATELAASLTVKDVGASVAWYRDVIGFTVHQTYGPAGTLRAASMRAGDVRLLLVQDDGAKGLDRAKGDGFSLQLTTTQDIDALASGIVARGGALVDPPADAWGARVFRLRDLDGFLLVISSPRA